MNWRMTYQPDAVKLPTYVFDQQREACQTCAHGRSVVSTNRAAGSALLLRCSLIDGPASLARLDGQLCGPDARKRVAS
jgi:hypothetical protein